MTAPDPWGDERLDAAFRARASSPSARPPTGLAGSALAAIDQAPARAARSWNHRLLPAALVGAVALALLGSLVLPGTTRPDPSAPTGPSGAPSPFAGQAPSLASLPAVTVADLVEAAAAGPTPVEVVVQGWLSRSSATFACASVDPHPLVPAICEGRMYMTDLPPDGDAPHDLPADLPEPFVVPMLRVDSHVEVSLPRGGSVEVVAIGHQADHRWATCASDEQAACKGRFVIDRLLPADAMPDDASPSPWERGAPTAHDPEDVVAALTDAVGDLTVVSIGHIDSDSLPTIEPIIDGQRGPSDVIWIVRALTASRGAAVARTFLLSARSLSEGAPVITEVTETSVEPVWPLKDPPSAVLGLPIISVTDALAVRDAGIDDRELAVRGWFPPIAPIGCPAPERPPVSPLEPNCPDQWVVLTLEPEALFTVEEDGVSGRLPTGPAFQIDLDGIDTSWQPGLPELGQVPTAEIVVIGHFDDRRAALCPTDVEAACRDRFVVDRVNSVNGELQPLSLVELLDGQAPVSTPAGVLKTVSDVAPQATVLSVVTIGGMAVGAIEPTFQAYLGRRYIDWRGTDIGGALRSRPLWVIRAVDPGRSATYIAQDGTGVVWRMSADNEPIIVAGTLPEALPAPSDGPLPSGQIAVIELTSQIGAGRPKPRVAVIDQADIVAAVREVGPEDRPMGSGVGFTRDPDGDGRYRLSWVGSVCDEAMTVTIEPEVVRIVVDEGVRDACDAMAIGRELVFDFARSVDTTGVELVVVPARTRG